MAKRLSPDGVPVDIPSIRRKKATNLFKGIDPSSRSGARPGYSGDDPTQVDPAEQGGSARSDDTPTMPPYARDGAALGQHVPESLEARTRIAGGFRQRAPLGAVVEGAEADPQPIQEFSEDPVVGWLVVVDGPGKGSSIRLGMGQNSVGRGARSRARVSFGDDQISRSDHAKISYDPRSSTFHIHPGSGPNLTYLDDAVIHGPTPLPNRSRIGLGETTLRFVALCDDRFNWSDRSPGGGA